MLHLSCRGAQLKGQFDVASTWRHQVMNHAMSKQVLCVVIAALTVVASGCKRTDNGNPGALNSESSGVMSNSAGGSGTPGSSDAARRVDSSAGGAASATDPAASEAPVVSTPASAASQ
jgi:hypothetical protein